MKWNIVINTKYEFKPKDGTDKNWVKNSFYRELILSSHIDDHAFSVEEANSSLIQREQLGCLAYGGGVACPHTKLESISNLGVVYAYMFEKQVNWPFGSMDDKPVKIAFLILFPFFDHTHLIYMAESSKLGKLINLQNLNYKKFQEAVSENFKFMKDTKVFIV